MTEETKAIADATAEVAKTAGKAIDAGREAGGFIAKYVAGPLEQAMGIWEDKLKYTRWERQHRLMQRADQFLREAILTGPVRPVPLSLAIPLLQGGSLEEDDSLQDRWAALLVNAANPAFSDEIRRAFIAVLEEITALDAANLDCIYSLPMVEASRSGVSTYELPTRASLAMTGENYEQPAKAIMMSVANLARLSCIEASRASHHRSRGRLAFGKIYPTVFGEAFVRACKVPK